MNEQEQLPKETTFLIKDATSAKMEREQGVLYRERFDRWGKEAQRFELRKSIGGLNYIFVIFAHDEEGEYGINFKTEQNDYALTNAGKEGLNEIFLTIRNIIKAINTEAQIIKKLLISPADHAYSTEEIRICKEELIKLDHTIDPQKLDMLDGFEILDKYKELTGKAFPLKRTRNKAFILRSRLFKMYFKKYFPDWKIQSFFANSDGYFSLIAPEIHAEKIS